MNIRKKFVFQQAMSIKSEAKTKKLGVAGWKVGQTWHRNNCSHAKKVQQKYRDIACKANFFPSLFETGSWNLCCNILQCGSKRNNWNIWAKNCFCMIFCTRSRLMYERLWQIALADQCINKPLKNLSWSYWRLIWRQNCFDMYHWALERSEKFHFERFEI